MLSICVICPLLPELSQRLVDQMPLASIARVAWAMTAAAILASLETNAWMVRQKNNHTPLL